MHGSNPRSGDPETHDVIGIGLGPFNLSLACLMAPLASTAAPCRALFLERHSEFNWHPGMLIDDTTLQNPCLADLVSLADPTSEYSYLNYCKHSGEIYSHYINGPLHISREAYNRYCQWVSQRLPNVRFGHDVVAISHDAQDAVYRIHARRADGSMAGFAARKLVLGVGAQPSLPACCEASTHPYLHTAHYLQHKASLLDKRSVTIVGSGQSAAEVCHDLLKEAAQRGTTVNWITRSPYFFQMETTRLTLEMFSPDYTDYFYNLPDDRKPAVLARQDSLYKGINARLMDDIYHQLEQARRRGRFQANLVTQSELRGCRHDADTALHVLEFQRTDTGEVFEHRTDGLIFATGYRQRVPRFLGGIESRLRFDRQGRYQPTRNYAVDTAGREVYVQNGGLHSHGLSNPELGLACYRNSCLIRELTGVAHYPIETGFALQSFGVPRSPLFTPITTSALLPQDKACA
ncbi:alcaligin biosynthesis protein [Pelomonas sp. HMWF004]|nr:alcaligin biosynthesis protein [Pelomonas sp. HMWF004]